jgi:hypothetical protein
VQLIVRGHRVVVLKVQSCISVNSGTAVVAGVMPKLFDGGGVPLLRRGEGSHQGNNEAGGLHGELFTGRGQWENVRADRATGGEETEQT